LMAKPYTPHQTTNVHSRSMPMLVVDLTKKGKKEKVPSYKEAKKKLLSAARRTCEYMYTRCGWDGPVIACSCMLIAATFGKYSCGWNDKDAHDALDACIHDAEHMLGHLEKEMKHGTKC